MEYRFKFDRLLINKNRNIFILCIIFAVLFDVLAFTFYDFKSMAQINYLFLGIMLVVLVYSFFGLRQNTYQKEMMIIDKSSFSYRALPNAKLQKIKFSQVTSFKLSNDILLIKLKKANEKNNSEIKIKNVCEVSNKVLVKILSEYQKKERQTIDIIICDNEAIFKRNNINSILTLVIIGAIIVLSYLSSNIIIPSIGIILFFVFRSIEPKLQIKKIIGFEDRYYIEYMERKRIKVVDFAQNNIEKVSYENNTLTLNLAKKQATELKDSLNLSDEGKAIVLNKLELTHADELIKQMKTSKSDLKKEAKGKKDFKKEKSKKTQSKKAQSKKESTEDNK